MIDVHSVMATLATQRQLYHSEADFQHAFAWEVHKKLPNASIRLELPIEAGGKTYHLDLWAKLEHEFLAVELKYKTRRFMLELPGENYRLANHNAHDCGRYDFIKDIQRLEHVKANTSQFSSYAILLTNDSAYWTGGRNAQTIDAAFRLPEGHILHGDHEWGPLASEGTRRGREATLTIAGHHELNWRDYSTPSRATTFRYLAIRL